MPGNITELDNFSMKYETILVLRESHEDQKVIRNELNLI